MSHPKEIDCNDKEIKQTTQEKQGQLEQLERLGSEIPPAAPWLHILVIHIRSHVKTWQSKSYKFKKIAKNSNFEISQETLHATHLLELFDKMCKYEMDPTRTVGVTEWTRDAGRRDGRTDGQTDGRSETNIPPPPKQLRCAEVLLWHNVYRASAWQMETIFSLAWQVSYRYLCVFNTLRPKQNVCHFPDDFFFLHCRCT